tara:strand:+ start:6743 stop:7159 length:417 start_codon:yes stop_codon:yes gene_type:complete
VAKHILYDAEVVVNSVDLSDHVESVEFPAGLNSHPAAAMSDIQDYDLPGTQTVGPVVVNFYQDYAASKVYATLQPLWANRTTFTMTVKATTAGDSATNPKFSASFFLASAPFIGAARGDRHMVQATFNVAGALTFDVS